MRGGGEKDPMKDGEGKKKKNKLFVSTKHCLLPFTFSHSAFVVCLKHCK